MNLKLTTDVKLPTHVLGLDLVNGDLALAACLDGTVGRVFLNEKRWEAFATPHRSYASGVACLAERPQAVSAGYDGRLLWHDLETGKSSREVAAHQFWSWQLTADAKGQQVASVTGQYLPGGWKYEPAAGSEPGVKVYDAVSGNQLKAFAHLPPVQSVAFSPDGRFLAAANMMGEVCVWDLQGEEKPLATWKSEAFTSWGTTKTHHYCGGIFSLDFSPDGQWLLGCGMGPMGDPMAGNGKMTWQKWNWRTGEKVGQINEADGGKGLMESIRWSPDGQKFAMAGRQAQGTWNLAIFAADGKLLVSQDTKMRISQLHWTPDGQRLLTAGGTGQPQPDKDGKWPSYGRVQIWELETA